MKTGNPRSRTGNPLSPEPFVSCAKALLAKRSEKGYGDEDEPKLPVSLSQWGLVLPSGAPVPAG